MTLVAPAFHYYLEIRFYDEIVTHAKINMIVFNRHDWSISCVHAYNCERTYAQKFNIKTQKPYK